MSVFKDKHIELCDLWRSAFENYVQFRGIVERIGWNDGHGALLGQYYGMMCGLANAERHLFDMNTLWDEMEKYETEVGMPLFKQDFKKNGS